MIHEDGHLTRVGAGEPGGLAARRWGLGVLRWVVVGLMVVSGVGCVDPLVHVGLDNKRYPKVAGRHRSVVFESPQMEQLAYLTRIDGAGSERWYETRREDQLPATYLGELDGDNYRTFTLTIDRQVITNGRVREHYSSTTYHQTGPGGVSGRARHW